MFINLESIFMEMSFPKIAFTRRQKADSLFFGVKAGVTTLLVSQ